MQEAPSPPWLSFREHTPEVCQAITVHTFSGMIMDCVYDPALDLEGICDRWMPRNTSPSRTPRDDEDGES